MRQGSTAAQLAPSHNGREHPKIDETSAMAVLAAEHAVSDLRAMLTNGVTLTRTAAGYVADLLTIIDLGLEVKRAEVGLQPRQAA